MANKPVEKRAWVGSAVVRATQQERFRWYGMEVRRRCRISEEIERGLRKGGTMFVQRAPSFYRL